MNYTRTLPVETAAAKAGFSASTGHRFRRDPRLPSEKVKPRGSRRPDPLDGLFESEVVPLLTSSPQLRPVAVFEELLRRHPDLNPGIRRTLEHRIRRWRALHGPDREVIFRQDSLPGQLGISDFTCMDAFAVTVAGEAFGHMLYHFRLPWSGFTHAHVVRGGESFRALSKGLQDALRLLGGTPSEHRTEIQRSEQGSAGKSGAGTSCRTRIRPRNPAPNRHYPAVRRIWNRLRRPKKAYRNALPGIAVML